MFGVQFFATNPDLDRFDRQSAQFWFAAQEKRPSLEGDIPDGYQAGIFFTQDEQVIQGIAANTERGHLRILPQALDSGGGR